MRWTTGHRDVDGNHVRDAAGARVALAEYATGAAAVADPTTSFGFGVASYVRLSVSSMLRATFPVISKRSACRGLATNLMAYGSSCRQPRLRVFRRPDGVIRASRVDHWAPSRSFLR